MAAGDTLVVFTPTQDEPPATGYATLGTRNSHPLLDFDGSSDEEAVFTAIMPRHYTGGGLTITTYWSFASATTGSLRVQASVERLDVSNLDIDGDSFAGFQ